jgi:hypothetical protein
MNEITMRTHQKVQAEDGTPVLDDSFGESKDQPFTKKDFEAALKKASRKTEPKKK